MGARRGLSGNRAVGFTPAAPRLKQAILKTELFTVSNPTPNYCGTIILLELLLEVDSDINLAKSEW